MNSRSLITISVYLAVSALIFASDSIQLGDVYDVSVSPAAFSLLLLIPLLLWHNRYKKQELPPHEGKADGSPFLIEAFTLFLLAMIVRIPIVLLLGMAYEKTAVVYLLVLTVVYIKRRSLGDFGFKSEHLLRALLVGLAYYLVFAVSMFTAFFGLVYLFAGHWVIVSYDPFPALFVFPFMTLCVGVSEEGLFRGFIQTRLAEAYTEKTALLVQALLFGVWHFVWHVSPFNPLGMIAHVSTTFIFGLAFGQFYRKAGNLVPLILAHGLVDTVGYGAVIHPELETMELLTQSFQLLSFLAGIIILGLCTDLLARKIHTSHE